MIEHTPEFYAVAGLAVLFAAISKGGFGSGAAFAATPILALVIPPGEAIGLMLPLLMIMDFSALRPYWRKWSGRDAGRLILGAVPGVGLGALFYTSTHPDHLRLFLGLMALAFLAYQAARARGWIRAREQPYGRVPGLIAGTAAGFTSFISHAGGPPAAIYLLSQKLTKTGYQGTTVITFWVINLMKAPPYALTGIFSKTTLQADLVLAPVAVLGVWLGVKAHTRIPERVFFALTYVLLGLTGTKLVWDALT